MSKAKFGFSWLDLHDDIIPVDDFYAENYQLGTNSVIRTKGVCVIIDIANLPIKFIKYATPHNISTALKRLQALPIKEFKFHVVNDSLLVSTAVKIIWAFLPKSIQEAVQFHFSNWESLYQYIDKESLPVEYGGQKKEPYSVYHKKLFENNDEIARNFKIRRQFFLERVQQMK